MKKFLLSLGLLAGLSFGASAAVILFEDDFNTGTAGTDPAGWTRLDIYTATDNAATGLASNNTGVNGATVETIDNIDFYLNGGASSSYSIQVTPSMNFAFFYELSVFARNSGSSPASGRIYFTTAPQTETGGVPDLAPLDGQVTNITGTDEWAFYKVGFRVIGPNVGFAGQPLYINLESFADDAPNNFATIAWDFAKVEQSIPEPTAAIQAVIGLLLIGTYRKFRDARGSRG